MAGLGYNNANSTFLLISLENANIQQATVASSAYTTNNTWNAGQIGYFSSGDMVCVDGSAAATSKFRVLVASKTSSNDETLPTGTVGYVAGPHVGRTTQFESDITSATAPGTALYVSTNGKFTLTGGGSKVTSCPVVGTLAWCDGTWLQYEWSHVGATPTT
jgi:hypothetical protein